MMFKIHFIPVAMLLGLACLPAIAEPRKPNVIFILADDLGWGELGSYGNTFNETPNLDRLASQGMRFTRAYAAAPVCSPMRCSLMTGQWPARQRISDYLRPDDSIHLKEELTVLPEVLKSAGYATGIIGKWHLTGYASAGAYESSPDKHGFDEVILSENAGIAGGSYFHPYHFNQSVARRLGEKEYLTDRLNLEAVDFIHRHKEQPFFLYLAHYAPHTKLNGKPDLVWRFKAKSGAGDGKKGSPNNPDLAAMLYSIDEGVGKIMATLDELKLAGDTILIFNSDNGGETNVTVNGPLRGGKSMLYEGGIREPLIVRWPGRIAPGSVCDIPVNSVDYFPTFAAVAGAALPAAQPFDGVSILPLWLGKGEFVRKDPMIWHYPLDKPHFLGGRSAGAIQEGDWKLIEFFDTGEVELYNLKDEIGEKRNLAAAQPDRKNELLAKLKAVQKQMPPPPSKPESPAPKKKAGKKK